MTDIIIPTDLDEKSILVDDDVFLVMDSVAGYGLKKAYGSSMGRPFVTVGQSVTSAFPCDGVSDHVQIQDAIDAVASDGGGVVYFLPSSTDYDIGATILIPDNVVLRGAYNASKLRLANGADCRVIQEYDQVSGNTGFGIYGLLIDGNGDNQSDATKDALHFQFSTDFRIDKCHIKDGKRHNILISDSCSNVIVTRNRLKDPKTLSNCSTFNADHVTFAYNISTGAVQTGCKFDGGQGHIVLGNQNYNNSTHQIYLTNGTTATVTGNSVQGGTSGIRLTSNDYVSIGPNTCRGHSQNGIELFQNCNYVSITGAVVRDIGSGVVNTYDGVNIDDSGTGCTNVSITGCQIIDTQSKMRYGIYSGNNSDYVFHGINQIVGHQTGAYSLVGSNNKYVTMT